MAARELKADQASDLTQVKNALGSDCRTVAGGYVQLLECLSFQLDIQEIREAIISKLLLRK